MRHLNQNDSIGVDRALNNALVNLELALPKEDRSVQKTGGARSFSKTICFFGCLDRGESFKFSVNLKGNSCGRTLNGSIHEASSECPCFVGLYEGYCNDAILVVCCGALDRWLVANTVKNNKIPIVPFFHHEANIHFPTLSIY